jgi:hypothetical protein
MNGSKFVPLNIPDNVFMPLKGFSKFIGRRPFKPYVLSVSIIEYLPVDSFKYN